ncbi:MAG TPA: tyrosine/phenylalanine carboxypeptidase domain-containing protein [Polyangiaceae bacterium]|nr:tyrosine/phenylalanine carboxypeptidase domain-containing protein [Polyangiaceae bacterium]
MSAHHDDPFWLRTVQVALEGARSVRVLGAATPKNAAAERARLGVRWAAGHEVAPEWLYAPQPADGTLELLETLAKRASAAGGELGEALVERLQELALEARLMACVGTPAFAELAGARYPAPGRGATALARRWLRLGAAEAGPTVATDDEGDSRSLVRQIRRLAGETRLPFTVQTTAHLSSLAAVGERTIYVARARATTDRVALRTAIHEVYGHALPRARASGLHPLLALGTARGADDQEGLALLYERRAGLLDDERRAELARRHAAAAAMRGGASFVEVVRMLRSHGAELEGALVAAERVFRGGDGRFGGLGRESVYLASFSRVRAHLRRRPGDEAVMSSGQVSVARAALASTLVASRQLAGRQALPCPPPTSATG